MDAGDDWREPFLHEHSTLSWERAFDAAMAGRGWFEDADLLRTYRGEWHRSSGSVLALDLSATVASIHGADTLPDSERSALADAVRRMIAVTQQQLTDVGLDRLRLYRGIAVDAVYAAGDDFRDAAPLSSWSADLDYAASTGHKHRDGERRLVLVLETVVSVEQVVMLFAPADDAEAVLIGPVDGVVRRVEAKR